MIFQRRSDGLPRNRVVFSSFTLILCTSLQKRLQNTTNISPHQGQFESVVRFNFQEHGHFSSESKKRNEQTLTGRRKVTWQKEREGLKMLYSSYSLRFRVAAAAATAPPVETVLHNHNSFLLNGFPFPFVFEAVDHRRLDDDPVNPLPRGAVR